LNFNETSNRQLELEKEVAIVTGGARGIGRGIVKELLSQGCRVIIADIDIEEANKTARELASDERCLAFKVDVAKSKQVEKLVNFSIEAFGMVSILVNNAGIQTDCEVLEMPEKLWDETINVNLKGAFNCSKMAAKKMYKHNKGRIINISSVSARRGSKKHTHYCAAKAGVIGFTKALALELAKYNITVNAICPGIVKTQMAERIMDFKRDKWLSEMPLKRFGRPEDIAFMVSFLASVNASWITGQTFDVNGGIFMM